MTNLSGTDLGRRAATDPKNEGGESPSSFSKYPEYKDSGVEWLGEVPEHWDMFSLKRSVEGCVNGLWGDEPDGVSDLAVIRVADFDRDTSRVGTDKLTYRSVTQKERASRLLQPGDLLIEKSGGGEKTLVGCVVLFEHDFPAITSNFVARMRPLEGFDHGFLCYAFDNLYHGKVNYPAIKQTTGIQNLDSEAYLQERFCFPPRAEQRSITHFLDHETAKIDALVREQQRLIELLKEKRQAVISHAVIKGLDPDVPMKDSGVEWLGEVPAHWCMKPFFSRFSERREPNRGMQNDNLLSLSYGRIINKDINTLDGLLPESYETYQMVHPGDVIFRLTDLQNDKRSLRSAIVLEKGIITSAYLAVSEIGMNPIFGAYLFRAYDLMKVFYSMGGGLRQSMKFDDIRRLPIPCPEPEEQAQIAAFLDHETAKTDELVSVAHEGIELLNERRSALISAAVTGKIDVRHWRPPADESAYDPKVRGAGLETVS